MTWFDAIVVVWFFVIIAAASFWAGRLFEMNQQLRLHERAEHSEDDPPRHSGIPIQQATLSIHFPDEQPLTMADVRRRHEERMARSAALRDSLPNGVPAGARPMKEPE